MASASSFKGIDDGYSKIVITMDDDPFDDLGDGYRKINIFDFLLNLTQYLSPSP